jgi:hypothetical protein
LASRAVGVAELLQLLPDVADFLAQALVDLGQVGEGVFLDGDGFAHGFCAGEGAFYVLGVEVGQG